MESLILNLKSNLSFFSGLVSAWRGSNSNDEACGVYYAMMKNASELIAELLKSNQELIAKTKECDNFKATLAETKKTLTLEISDNEKSVAVIKGDLNEKINSQASLIKEQKTTIGLMIESGRGVDTMESNAVNILDASNKLIEQKQVFKNGGTPPAENSVFEDEKE